MVATGKPDAKNVSVAKPGVLGHIFVAPLGAKLPTNASDPLDAAFVSCGYISEDGSTNAHELNSPDAVKAFGGDPVLIPPAARTETFTATFIETNEATLKIVYGDKNVTGVLADGTLHVAMDSADLGEHSYVWETIRTGGIIQRTVVERGKVTELGNTVFNDTDPIGYETTITALVGSDGKFGHIYYAKIASDVTPGV